MKEVNNFIKGMDKDTSDELIGNQSYRHLENGDIFYGEGESTAAIVDINGNRILDIEWAIDYQSYLDISGYPDISVVSAEFPYDQSFRIVGVGYIRDDIILIYVSLDGHTIIDLLKYNKEYNTYTRINIIFNELLNMSINNKVAIESNYENEALIKIYFIEKSMNAGLLNDLRSINVAPDTVQGVTKDCMLQGSYSRYRVIPSSGIGTLGMIGFNELKSPRFIRFGNGSLRSGAYMYCYRYVNKNSNKTSISDLTPILYLSKSNQLLGTEELMGSNTIGSFNEINSGKSIELSIDGTTGYTHIEIIRVYYNSLNSSPDVHVIKRQEIGANDITIVDSSFDSTIDTLTPDELNKVDVLLCPKAMDSKNERLFIGNIIEDTFDAYFDARAYSFDSNRIARLFNEGDYITPTYIINGDDPTSSIPPYTNWEEIPYSADVVNPTNIIGNDYNPILNDYKYMCDGVTRGAQGLRVVVSFQISTINIDSMNVEGKFNAYSTSETSLFNNLGINKIWNAGEIYRYGVVFRDNYGRISPVKYIADIRIPNYSYIYGTGAIDMRHFVKTATPVISISTSGTPMEGMQYMIVYVKRGNTDRTVITEGLATNVVPFPPTYEESRWFEFGQTNYMLNRFTVDLNNGSTGTFIERAGPTCPVGGIGLQKIIGLVSPEIVYNKNTDFSNTIIEFIGNINLNDNLYEDRVQAWGAIRNARSSTPPCHPDYETTIYKYLRASIINIVELSPNYVRNTVDSALVVSGGSSAINSLVISAQALVHIPDNDGLVKRHSSFVGDGCTTHYIDLDMTTGAMPFNDPLIIPYIRVRRDITQYGGRSYSSIMNNVFIPASPFTNTFVKLTYGDTFYTMFEYQRTQEPLNSRDDDNDPNSAPYWYYTAETVVIPLQSSINTNFRSADSFNTLYNGMDSSIAIAKQVREEGLGYFKNQDFFTLSYHVNMASGVRTSLKPLYTYNSVYSKLNDSRLFTPISNDALKINKFDTRIRYSDEKVDGEFYDSWLEFRALNFRDLDKEFGSLNFILNFNDNLFAWQDNGFAYILVNPLVQMATNEGMPLVLGTGSVLHDIKYLSTHVGIQNINEAVSSNSGIYWLDVNKKKIYRYSNTLESISDIKSMSSYFKKTIKDNTIFIGVYDHSRKTVLLSIINYIGNTIDRNIYTVTISNATTLVIVGNTDNLNMKVGLNYELIDNLNNIGEYRLDTIAQNSLTFTYLSGNILSIGDIEMTYYLSYYSSFTISFDEYLDMFKSFESFIPDLYLKGNKQIFSTSNSRIIYEHNTGNLREFYGIVHPLILDYVANANRALNKSFGAIEIENVVEEGVRDYKDTLDYNGVENITFDKIRVIGDRNITEYLDLYVKDSKIDTEIIGGLSTGNIDSSVYSSSNRSIHDTNGIRIIPYPAYLYNVRMTLNKFRTILPRIKTNLFDNDSRLITEFVRGTSATIRLIYNKIIKGRLKVKNITTYTDTSESK